MVKAKSISSDKKWLPMTFSSVFSIRPLEKKANFLVNLSSREFFCLIMERNRLVSRTALTFFGMSKNDTLLDDGGVSKIIMSYLPLAITRYKMWEQMISKEPGSPSAMYR